eukprot:5387900-Alexandrium_andersonii.AAC.1
MEILASLQKYAKLFAGCVPLVECINAPDSEPSKLEAAMLDASAAGLRVPMSVSSLCLTRKGANLLDNGGFKEWADLHLRSPDAECPLAKLGDAKAQTDFQVLG